MGKTTGSSRSCRPIRSGDGAGPITVAQLEAIAWKYRTNLPWRDLPEELGSFQTAHKRLIRWAVDGT